jgi:hypothetical protein
MSPLKFITRYGKIDSEVYHLSLDVGAMVKGMQAF